MSDNKAPDAAVSSRDERPNRTPEERDRLRAERDKRTVMNRPDRKPARFHGLKNDSVVPRRPPRFQA
jgi:hypothetical protein